MDELKYKPVSHDHGKFLRNALKREGFHKAYDDLEEEYALVREMLSARSKSGLTFTPKSTSAKGETGSEEQQTG